MEIDLTSTIGSSPTRSWMSNSYRDEVKDGATAGESLYEADPCFVRQEACASSIVRLIVELIGIPVTSANSDATARPPNGYESSFQ